MNQKLTPLMRQYWDVKSAHTDKIVLFRMGDFFEIFHDDALVAAPILGIALTKRNQKAADETPMCGVPHHSIGAHINKLLRAVRKVAICDQIEDPKDAKGIVKRAVTRILSPGMVYDPDTLDQLAPNFIAAIDDGHVAFTDTSTGESFYFETATPFERSRVLEVLRPSEIVLSSEQMSNAEEFAGAHLSAYDDKGEGFQEGAANEELPPACTRLRGYVSSLELSPGSPRSQLAFEKRGLATRLELTQNTIRHLELFENTRGLPQGSFFQVLNKTKTPGGSRLLRTWIAFPLCDQKQIEARLDDVESWINRPDELREVRTKLAAIGDLERRTMKLSNPNCNARDLQSFCQSLGAALELPLPGRSDNLSQICNIIARTIVDEPPAAVRDGHIIKRGVSPELDQLITLSEDSQTLLAQLEARERQRTGITSLKIRYNNVFGYSIEVTNTHKTKVPPDYRRKQTLATAERYLTDELESLEKRILSARSQRVDLELQLFEDLRQKVLAELSLILKVARESNQLDAITGLAWVAIESGFCRPRFHSGALTLESSRHPVVERLLTQPFVANDIRMNVGDCMLLTGPNMAGKSTLMRQVALTVVLAQMGSFVPAKQAVLPLFTKILTRIGASDSLSEGLSTFMVEMKETAELIQEADSRSLVILDEVGRGTSTYDGMSLAQAILEHLIAKNRATIFFATHYHELTQLEGAYPNVANHHMGIRDRSGQLSFLYTLMKGPANKSYGIHVAKLAGLPPAVVARAERILTGIERNQRGQLSLFQAPGEAPVPEETLPEPNPEFERLVSELKRLPIESTTPLDALKFVAKWQHDLRD
ncbi:MAG TPA: DNA mismatch repair protein MutS [Bdellovibrionales bacterium]|nr:DNA mismatch repair protein MutS [Bdellovibrionales bacterium]